MSLLLQLLRGKRAFIVRVKGPGGAYAEVAVPGGAATTVARLAQLACDASPQWGVGAGGIALHLVAASGDDLPSSAVEAAAAPVAQVGWTLKRAGVGHGAWLVARLAAPAAAPALDAIAHAVMRNTTANRRAELERLLIRPTFSVASSPSRGVGGARSPKSQERFQLKLEVISFYGLWDPATADEPDVALRRVFTMLPERGSGTGDGDARVSVALSDAILAHIWPSVLASESDAMRRLLGLPSAFHLNARNFLILDKTVETAFDADALLLLPVRAAPPAPPRVRARLFRLAEFPASSVAESGAAARNAVAALAGRDLFLPLAADGRVPFMRLLAWKALSALRAGAEDADESATTTFPDDVDLDATLTRGEGGRARGATGFAALLSTGLVFGFGARA